VQAQKQPKVINVPQAPTPTVLIFRDGHRVEVRRTTGLSGRRFGSRLCAFWICLTVLLTTVVSAQRSERNSSLLDHGFAFLYELRFADAQAEFSAYERQAPENALGPAAEAAGILFQELNRMGILESHFFADDPSYKRRPKLRPDPELQRRFDDAVACSEALAQKRLMGNDDDHDALFALALTSGLRADYAALVEDRGYAALRLTRKATTHAQVLLAVCPTCYDAYVGTGIAEYLIGSLSLPSRLILRVGGYKGDKQQGLKDLELAAERGHYLGPFARILLAIAYIRERQPESARRLLAQLQRDFPQNPLYARELGRLDQKER
jgi:hypothetical protein